MSETSQSNPSASAVKKRSLGTGYRAIGMVSFVDILANGLIVMILLIFITIKVNKDIKQSEEESMRDIGVMMSRKMATELASNSIPTNSPAYLHDYANSPFDMNPLEQTMPILELHERFVRLYYSGDTIAYRSLFKDNNGLDTYLNGLTDRQRERIRMDVYAIRPYYITMSVLKEYGIQIRHWHLLGYTSAPPMEQPYHNTTDAPEQRPNDADGTQANSGDTPAPSERATRHPPQGTLPGVPNVHSGVPIETPDTGQEFSFPDMDLTEKELRALGQFLKKLQKTMPNLPVPPNLSDTPENRERLKNYLEKLAQQLAQDNPSPPFRIPDDDTPQIPFVDPSAPGRTNVPDPLLTIAGLIHYLQKKQTAYDNRVMSDISVNELMLLFGILQSDRTLLESLPYFPLALNIYSQFMNALKDPEHPSELRLEQQINDTFNSRNELHVKKNQFADRSTLQSQSNQPVRDIFEQPIAKPTELIIRQYPTYYKGETVSLGDNTIVIVPPNQIDPSRYRWRLIAVIRNDLKNTVMGYTYAAVDKNGDVIFPVPQNTITFGNAVIASNFPVGALGANGVFLLFYAIMAVVVGVLFLRVVRP